jgi:hypothetical protein
MNFHDGATSTQLLPPVTNPFACFDAIDEEDTDTEELDESTVRRPKKSEPLFDGTGYGFKTFERPEVSKNKKPPKAKAAPVTTILGDYVTLDRRIGLSERLQPSLL